MAPAPPPPLDGRLRRLRRRLLDWYDANGRDLAWRRTREPYAILVSEIMLQQTQAGRVGPAWQAFLERFPDVPALARAPRSAVLQAWEGLGYNRRAVSLHAAAQAIRFEHGGRVPADLTALQALPGVGAYTARAVLAFAFDAPVAPVDTNVARVLARAVAGHPLSPTQVQETADRLVPSRAPGRWSQALMDLGAQACGARVAHCSDCPLRRLCSWQRVGGPDPSAQGAARSRPQGSFAGSDRYHRGRIVDALRRRPVGRWELASAAQLNDETRLHALVARVVADGLAEWDGDTLRLPS